MTFRRFVDSSGKKWEVWEVVPAFVDNRRRERRALNPRSAPPSSSGERRKRDRRIRTLPGYVRVSPGFERGWLCFASGTLTRRLAPIPGAWENADPEQLELWSREASTSWTCSAPSH